MRGAVEASQRLYMSLFQSPCGKDLDPDVPAPGPLGAVKP
jgi:hypothetical protein